MKELGTERGQEPSAAKRQRVLSETKRVSEVYYENSCPCVSDASLHSDIRMEWVLIFAGGPLGILLPILLALLDLWMGRGECSPRYVKAALLAALAVLLLIMFGYL